jgi:hypothetical protein
MDKYFSLKLMKRDNSLRKQKSFERSKSSNQDLIDQDTYDHNEEARLAEEALAANLKLLKKQKARFMRLQKILSRNVILIPVCAILSFLSASLMIASTFTDQFEFVKYDVEILKIRIDAENNKTLKELNYFLNSDFSLNQIFNRDKFELLLKEHFFVKVKTTNNNDVHENLIKNTNNEYNKENNRVVLFKKKQMQSKQAHLTTTLPIVPPTTTQLTFNLAYDSIKEMYLYELFNVSDDYFIVMYRSILSPDNSTADYNYIYDTYSGIWKICNYLSGKFILYGYLFCLV